MIDIIIIIICITSTIIHSTSVMYDHRTKEIEFLCFAYQNKKHMNEKWF